MMRLKLCILLLLGFISTLQANGEIKNMYLETCNANADYSLEVCNCSYKLFTRRYDEKLIGTKEKSEQFKKYAKACKTIESKLHVFTFNRLEQIINNGRQIGWEKLHFKQRDKMVHVINESRRLYFKACKSGFGTGCYNVARLYKYGISKDINLKKADEYLKKACNNGLESLCSE